MAVKCDGRSVPAMPQTPSPAKGWCQLDHRTGQQQPVRSQNLPPCPLVPHHLRTIPKALLCLARQHCELEDQWHCTHDTTLGEDSHRYSQRNGVQVVVLQRYIALKLLR
jgi:hypothetical protein